MKRLFTVLFCFFLITGISSQHPPADAGVSISIAGGAPASAAYSCDDDIYSGDFQERFECGSQDPVTGGNGDEENAKYILASGGDEDYTTTVLQGEQSFYVGGDAGTGYRQWAVTGGSTVNQFAFILTVPSSNTVYDTEWTFFELRHDASDETVMAQLVYDSGNTNWYVNFGYHAADESFTYDEGLDGVKDVEEGETWYVLVEYQASSGVDTDDGIAKLYMVKDVGAGFPGWGSADLSHTDCDTHISGDPQEVDTIYIYGNAAYTTRIYDDIRFDANSSPAITY